MQQLGEQTGPDTAGSNDFQLMIDAAREAGALALDYFRDRNNKSWFKGDGSAVSEADMAVDGLLHRRLLASRSDYGWLSEETRDDLVRLEKTHVWIVDPIDGTRAFLQGKPHWVVSIALVIEGDVVLGCLYNPVTDEMFEAERGRGARLNGAAIKVGSRQDLEGMTVIAAPGRLKSRKWPQPWPPVSTFMVNSIAYRLALLACGEADAVLALSGKSDWDLAAADLLLREAGGIASDHRGSPFTFNQKNTRHASVLAANPHLHAKMLKRTRQVEAGRRRGCAHN